MNFLKNLFGGAGQASNDEGLYVYVRPKMCKEILRLRIDMRNNLSRLDNDEGFYLRKLASGARCPFQVEVEFFFDNNKRMVRKEITNGEFVTEADYNALYNTPESEPQA